MWRIAALLIVTGIYAAACNAKVLGTDAVGSEDGDRDGDGQGDGSGGGIWGADDASNSEDLERRSDPEPDAGTEDSSGDGGPVPDDPEQDPGEPAEPEPEPEPLPPLDGCDSDESCVQYARQVLEALNADRAALAQGPCGGSALAWDDDLAAVAQGHSDHMAQQNQLTLDDPAGDLGARLAARAVDFASAGEVYGLARGTAAEFIADMVAYQEISAYFRSCDFSMAGVGASAGAVGVVYLTVTMISR